MVVICGEHTEASAPVSAELLIAQEERTPYFLLGGRRDSMCTKPNGAKPAEHLTTAVGGPKLSRNQLVLVHRPFMTRGATRSCRRPKGETW